MTYIKKLKKFIKKLIKFCIAILIIISWKFTPARKSDKTMAFVFRTSRWKHPYIPAFLKEYDIRFVPFDQKLKFLRYELEKYPNKVFVIWGFDENPEICEYASKHEIPVYRMEDGFVRSVGLGSMHTPPFSICLDKTGMYFDSTKPSDLENILNQYDFQNHPDLLAQARRCMDQLIGTGVSKYNHVPKRGVEEIYGPKTKKRILVIGQVEDDASIRKGSDKQWTNYDLVRFAYDENPGAEIIYKPHPDVLTGRRPSRSSMDDVRKLAKVVEEPLGLVDSFQTIDHVYTITSLSGFEALIRGLSVTTIGAPFYSGWGLTNDRQIVTRRKRKLTIEELFAGAYILYPRYINPDTKETITLEETIKQLIQQRQQQQAQ